MKRKKWWLVLVAVVAILFFGNPTQEQFLEEVAGDFGKLHHGMSLNTIQLEAMGESHYQSFYFYSTYHYSFGSIQVQYSGFAFMKFYLGSSSAVSPEPPNPLKST